MSLTRIVSGAVLIVVVGGTIWWFPEWTVVLAAAAAAVAGVELAALAQKAGANVPSLPVAVSCAALTVIVGWRGINVPVDLAVLAVMIASGLMALAMNQPGPQVFAGIGTMVFAPLYVGLPLGTMAWLAVLSSPPSAIVWLIAVIAISDSFQYFVGSAIGRNKLSPVISPGKTIEGLIGGLVAAALAGWAIALWAFPGWSWTMAAIAVVIALFGVGGDLFESLLKRSVGAKDSGAVIPGHGGVLDRIDAYLFAAPVFYLFLRYWQW